MDASDDLLLGILANYSWDEIEAYAVSVARSGFRGRKILLVWHLDAYTRDRLEERGFELVDCPPANMEITFGPTFFRHRDKLAFEFLRDHAGEFRYVLWLDIHDLILQADPSVWLEQNLNGHEIVIASESVLIKDEECNDLWLKALVTPETWKEIREGEVLNAGTVAGTQAAMQRLFYLTCQMNEWQNIISEQAAMNVILREPEFAAVTHVSGPNESFALVGYGFNPSYSGVWGVDQPVLRDGVLYPRGSSEPFAILHQYDRNPAWKDVIHERYQ